MTTHRKESAESPQPGHRRPRQRLTDATVKKLECGAGRKDRLIFDRDLPGFGVRVQPARQDGRLRRTFLFQYRSGGAVRRMVLGEWGAELTAAKARDRAERLRGEVRDKRDPLTDRRKRAAAERAEEAARKAAAAAEAFTFEKLLAAWDVRYLRTKRPTYRTDALGRIRTTLARLLTRPAADIDRAEAAQALQAAAAARGPVGANRVMAYARACYGWAGKAGLMTGNPFAGLPPLVDEVPRDRVLGLEELAAIWRATGALEDPHRAFVRVLLLTLQRRSEVAAAEWREFDLAAGTWTVPSARAKNKRQHVVHLSDGVKAELANLPRRPNGRFVFSLPGDGRITSFSAIKRRIDAEVRKERGNDAERLAGWTFHDFRRSGVSALATMGFPPHVCDRLLNHVTGAIQGVAAVYQRAEFLPERRAALEAWARLILGAAEKREPSTNVLQLRTGL